MSELKAGRELDGLVAEKVFGYRWVRWLNTSGLPHELTGRFLSRPGGIPGLEGMDYALADMGLHLSSECWATVPAYSTEIAAAWQVVEKMLRLHHCVRVGCLNPECEQWRIFVIEFTRDGGIHHLTATEAATRICRAALRASLAGADKEGER